MGYAGENESMWTNDQRYFGQVSREDSVFGKQCLYLKMVCWMNPNIVIEKIPADWDKLDVYIYHSYGQRFSMQNNVEIKFVPMSQINEKDCFTKVFEKPWPLPRWREKPRN